MEGGAYALVILFAVQTEHARKIIQSVVAKSVVKTMEIAVKENIAVTRKAHVVVMDVAPKTMASVARRRVPKKSCAV